LLVLSALDDWKSLDLALVLVDLLWFCINILMQQLTSGQKLQQAFRQHIAPYSKYVQCAVTLTLKPSAQIRVRRFENYGDDFYEFREYLDEEKLRSTITYFSAQLTKQLYGNLAKHKNKQQWAKPLVITVVEGRNTHKLVHLHMAIGNIPTQHLVNIAQLTQAAFERCDFANKQLCVKHVTSGIGWLDYITKEVGYTDNDALDIVGSTIPPFIQQSICTESRLLAA
jgi:hypothetical protein